MQGAKAAAALPPAGWNAGFRPGRPNGPNVGVGPGAGMRFSIIERDLV